MLDGGPLFDGIDRVPVPPPEDQAGWALECAGAVEAMSEDRGLTLADGTNLEADDALDGVILAVIAARGLLELTVDDVTELSESLHAIEHADRLDVTADYDASLLAVAARYHAVHAALGLSPMPDDAELDVLVVEIAKLVGGKPSR
jgi:hypothetical protein